MRERVNRLRQRSFLVAQVALAAALAWLVARELLDHEQPFFAPVAAIVSLGVSYGQRPRRVAEVTAGVAVGVGVADLFAHVAGTGTWQIAVVVAASMSVALLVDAGVLIVTQAAVQSVIASTLLPSPGAGLGRWLDAVVGGGVALVAAAIAPQSPLRRPREEAARVTAELAVLLQEAARSARDGDVERASQTLERARATDSALDELRRAAAEGLDVVRSSPFRRRHREGLRAVADLAEPLDRAVRNVRVLVRRVTVAAWRGEPVPGSYADLVARLGDAADRMAQEMAAGRLPVAVRGDLEAIAADSSRVATTTELSAVVVLAQVRSMVVDLLQLTGLDVDGALEQIPPPAGKDES